MKTEEFSKIMRDIEIAELIAFILLVFWVDISYLNQEECWNSYFWRINEKDRSKQTF